MTLDIRAVLEGAFEKTLTPLAGALMAVVFVIGLLNQVISVNMVVTVIQDHLGMAISGPTPFYAGISNLPVLVVMLVGVLLLSVWYTIVATRVFLNGSMTLDVPMEYITDGIPSRMGNLVVGIIGSTIAVGLTAVVSLIPAAIIVALIGGIVRGLFGDLVAGLMALPLGVVVAIPPTFVIIGLLFFPVIVVKEDASFLDAFRQSWEMVRGHRWRLLALGIIMALIGGALGLLGSQIGSLISVLNTEAQFLIQAVFTAVGNVFQIALLVETFQALKGDA